MALTNLGSMLRFGTRRRALGGALGLLCALSCALAVLTWWQGQASAVPVAHHAIAGVLGSNSGERSGARKFEIGAAVHDMSKGHHARLSFTGTFSKSGDFDKSVLLHGTGSTVDASGTVVVQNMTVELGIGPCAPWSATPLERGEYLITSPRTPNLMMYLQPTAAGGFWAIGASKGTDTVVGFDLPPVLVDTLTIDGLGSFAGALLMHFEPIDPVPVLCSPTFAECQDTATSACCSHSGVCSLLYSCLSDGSVTCSYTCCNPQK